MTIRKLRKLWRRIRRELPAGRFVRLVFDTPLIVAERERSGRTYAATELVAPGRFRVHVHSDILLLPDDFIYGILLHEAGHVGAWGQEPAEDAANEWVLKTIGIKLDYKEYHGHFLQCQSAS